MPFWNWSRTAATNATSDATINWQEGQAPSTINDSARAVMAGLASWRDDIAGAITTGGTSTNYTLTSFQGFTTLAGMNGQMIGFTPHATNGATVTLNVDGLGAKPVRQAPSTEILAGVLVAGTPYVATYYNATGEWILRNFYGNPYNTPLGAMLPYTADTAPNSAFILPFGQTLSRSTYASYFSLVSTRFGAGDGSSTFTAPDMRGRIIAGYDVMGGSAAGRLTSAGGGLDGTVIGAAGGSQNRTLVSANLPPHAHAGTTGTGGGTHSHTGTSDSTNTDHTHSGTTGGMSANALHAHTYLAPTSNSTTPGGGFSANNGTGSLTTTGNTNIDHTHTVTTGGMSANAAHTHTFTSNVTDISHTHAFTTDNGPGSSTALPTIPPAIVLNYILRIL